MKKYLALFASVAMLATAQQASAQFISQIDTSGGVTGDTNIVTDANLISFVAGGVTYDEFIGIGVNDPTPAARIWANTISDPGSDTIAVSDTNLATGSLNNTPDAVFDLTGQTLEATTTLYIIGNGNNGAGGINVDPETGDATGSGGTTPPNTLTFVDADGAALGTIPTDFFFQDPISEGGLNEVRAPNLMSFDVARDGDPITGRTVSGAVVTLGDITFTAGGISDIAGFTIGSSTADIQDVGIAFPASGGVLLGDANCDGFITFDDIGPFIGFLSGGPFKPEADVNVDGMVNFDDIATFISILSSAE